MKGRKTEAKKKEGKKGKKGETEKRKCAEEGKEKDRERAEERLRQTEEHAPGAWQPPAPALLLAWQPAGCAREWAPGGGGAQAGEPSVSVMCLSPNQFISYKQHDIRS